MDDSLLLNRYRIESPLGSGAMGVVHRGRDTLLDRPIAIKLLAALDTDEETRARWLHEAQAAARLQHPHVVVVHDAGIAGGRAFIVMELVEGGSLRTAGPLTHAQVVDVGIQLCEALEHAHANGIVHRDLKPENVLVVRRGEQLEVKLTDLGIALLARATRMTSDGAILGTAGYLAPEQALGGEVDGRTDLYALGVLLYEQVTGRLPFQGDDPLAVISQHLHAPVVPPRTWREDVPPALEGVIVKCLAKSPADRPRSAAEVKAALGAVEFTPTGAEMPTTAGTSDRMVMLDQLARGRLIGRRAELSQLQEMWRRAMRGQGHMALVSGEPGVGKTRLARESMVYAQLHGATVLQGGCYEFEAATPYLPFVEAIRHWAAAQPAERLREVLGGTASELARLAPGIAETLGPLPPSIPLSPQEERLRLFDSVSRFLQTLAAERGVLLFLDDLHWADHGTVALLHYLLRNLRDQRLMVLGAYREIELDRAHPLAAALVDWNRERLATRVAIGRLGLDDTSRMLAAMFGQDDVSRDFAEALHKETEGNPFFAEEVVKSLIEQGEIYRQGGEWQRREVQELTIPQSVKAAIGRRLTRLSPETVEVLHTAAALGKVFEYAELAAVASEGEDRLLDAIDEASAAQLLRADRGDSFAFTHDKIREVLHEELNPIRQRRLHQRIGESFEKLYADDLDAHVPDLAYHFAESSNLQKGLDYSLAAAERSERMYAHEEAFGFFERARECAEALESTEALCRIHEGIGRVYALRGQHFDAAASFERALALAPNASRRAALNGLAGEAYGRVSDPRGLDHLHAALREFESGQVAEHAMALANLGRYHHYRAETTKAVEYLEQALALAEPADDPFVVSMIYGYLAGAYQHMVCFAESLEWARRCIAYGERKGYPPAIATGNEFIAEDSVVLGLWREAVEAALVDRETGERMGSLDRMAWSDFARSGALQIRGELAEAAEVARTGLAIADRIGERRLGTFMRSTAAAIEMDRGNAEEALALAKASVESASGFNQIVLDAGAFGAMANVMLRTGDPAAAIHWCTRIVRAGEGTGNLIHIFSVEPVHLEALVRLGRLEEAAARMEPFLALCAQSGAEWPWGVALRTSGDLLAASDRPDEALASFDQSISMFDRLGLRVDLGRSLVRRGRLRAQRGEQDLAREDFARARTLFETCGAKPDLEALAANPN